MDLGSEESCLCFDEVLAVAQKILLKMAVVDH